MKNDKEIRFKYKAVTAGTERYFTFVNSFKPQNSPQPQHHLLWNEAL